MEKIVDISVVIPCYNNAYSIERAIESVVQQTWLPKEIIIGDDCSQDTSREIVRQFKERYTGVVKIIQVKNKENAGSAKARNIAWDVATSKYVAFLDADDSWHKKKLEIQFGYLLDHSDVDICGHKYEVVEEQTLPESKDVTVKSVLVLTLLKMWIKPRMCTPSVIIRRELSFRFRTFKNHSVDYLLWMEILLEGHKGVVLDVPLCFLHKDAYGAGGVSADMRKMFEGGKANIDYLREKNKIGSLFSCIMKTYITMKYYRRLYIVSQRNKKLKG